MGRLRDLDDVAFGRAKPTPGQRRVIVGLCLGMAMVMFAFAAVLLVAKG